MSRARRRLVVVADSDSYVKWGAAFASRLPAGWEAELVVVTTPVLPSERQLSAALDGTGFSRGAVRRLSLDGLAARLEIRRPDAVLLALRGPLVRVVAPIVGALPGRPVIMSGFPGLTIPAEPKAIVYREQVDLIVLHSRREVREFRANALALEVPVEFGLATLPFLSARDRALATPGADATGPSPAATDEPHGGDLVFAAQAKVPAEREDRVRMLGWLIEAARRRPARRVVVKVRARRGEAQTHAEVHDYAELLADPEVQDALGGPPPPNLVVLDGPMSRCLDDAAMLVTVSSTAALEAVAAGVPAVVVDEFGVEPRLINTVFEGSGLLAGADAITGWAPRRPDPAWLADNYFHGGAVDDWADRLDELLLLRAAGALPFRKRRHNLAGGALRRAFERKRMLGHFDRSFTGAVSMLVARPVRWVVRRVRRVRASRRLFA
ncbi:DUF6716 putative glycosyltransferase [Agromyces lapidis]|uniref:DUF6716 putative glycosyltransferase n=1 Tax=Agromyces lapidis TaxID=279574 RepID=A0ABV5SN56_9MICO|nr:DUF6716 putative glycosyltransferase [Agromyces lapidis]